MKTYYEWVVAYLYNLEFPLQIEPVSIVTKANKFKGTWYVI